MWCHAVILRCALLSHWLTEWSYCSLAISPVTGVGRLECCIPESCSLSVAASDEWCSVSRACTIARLQRHTSHVPIAQLGSTFQQPLAQATWLILSSAPCRPRAHGSIRRRRRPPFLVQACSAPDVLHQSRPRLRRRLPEGVPARVDLGRSQATPPVRDLLLRRRKVHGDHQVPQQGDGVVLARHPHLAHIRSRRDHRRPRQWFELQLDRLHRHLLQQSPCLLCRLRLLRLLHLYHCRPRLLPLQDWSQEGLPQVWACMLLSRNPFRSGCQDGPYASSRMDLCHGHCRQLPRLFSPFRRWCRQPRYLQSQEVCLRPWCPRQLAPRRQRVVLKVHPLPRLPQRWQPLLPCRPCLRLRHRDLMLYEQMDALARLHDVHPSRDASTAALIAFCIGVGSFEPGLVALLPACLLEAWYGALWHLTHVHCCSLAFLASTTQLLAVPDESRSEVLFCSIPLPSWALYLALSLRDLNALPTAQVLVWYCCDPLSAALPVALLSVLHVNSLPYPVTQVASRSCLTRVWACLRLTVTHLVPCAYSLLGLHECSWHSWRWPVSGRRAQLPVAPELTPGTRRHLSFSVSARAVPVSLHCQHLLIRTSVDWCSRPALHPAHAILGSSGYSDPRHSCALLRLFGAWWRRRRQPAVPFKPSAAPHSRKPCCSTCFFRGLPKGPRLGRLPFLLPGRRLGSLLAVARAPFVFSGWARAGSLVRLSPGTGSIPDCSGDLVPWLSPGWNTMPPRRDHRAKPWTAEQVSRLDCTTLHPGAEAICVAGVHFATLRGRLLLVLPHAEGTHSSDEFSYNVRIVGQSGGKVYAVNRDHLESPDDDTPRPRVLDDGLLGPRLRWKLYPPPLTLFTAPVLLDWRHLPRADSFFWRKDIEDSALAKYSFAGTDGARPGAATDDAAQSSESFEEVLVEEPGTERPISLAAASRSPEDELPISVQAGDLTLCSDDYMTASAEAAQRRSRSRRRRTSRRSPRPGRSRSPASSTRATRAIRTSEHDVPVEPASSSCIAAFSLPSSAALSGTEAPTISTTSSASAKPTKWTIPQWARKAINKRVREKQAHQAPEPPPQRPQGKSIWFVPDDVAEPAVSTAGSSRFPRAGEPAGSGRADSAAAAYKSAMRNSLLTSRRFRVSWLLPACFSHHCCLATLYESLPLLRFGEARLGLRWPAAVTHFASVNCIRIRSGCLHACLSESGPLGIELPNWLLEGMPDFWPEGSSPWSLALVPRYEVRQCMLATHFL